MPSESEGLRLDGFDNPGLGVPHDSAAGASPQMAQFLEQLLGLSHGVELQVDHHEVRVRDGTMDVVSTNARRLPVHGVTLECALPAFEVRNGMLNV